MIAESAGILIAGGKGTGGTAELYMPTIGLHCSLPDLPNGKYKSRHVQVDIILCGGFKNNDPDYDGQCLKKELILIL